jgi:uncharacterized protein YgiM (DUF1202 family)
MLNKKLSFVWLSLLAIVLAACNLPSSPSVQAATSAPSLPPAATAAPTATVALAPASGAVVISVTSESLNIRRGPSIYYDPVAFIKAGESATATGRDSSGDWLYIPLPGNASVFGWVSAKTQYSKVDGDIMALPVQVAAPANPAYIRNCTFHPMLIQPGNILLQPQTDKSGRKAHFAPGNYSAFDQNVSNTKVFTVDLHEGDSVDIHTDGLKNTYNC